MTALRLKKRTTFLWDFWRLKYKTKKERKVPKVCEYGDQMVGEETTAATQNLLHCFPSMVAHLQLEIVDTFVDSFAKDL